MIKGNSSLEKCFPWTHASEFDGNLKVNIFEKIASGLELSSLIKNISEDFYYTYLHKLLFWLFLNELEFQS